MKSVVLDSLNKTPVRTKSWVNINDISLGEINIDEIKEFNNIKIINNNDGVSIQKLKNNKILSLNKEFVFGVSDELISEAKHDFNSGYLIVVEKDTVNDKPVILEFEFDENNKALVDNLVVVSEENSKAEIIVKYKSSDDINTGYHNGICAIHGNKNSNIKVTKVNLLNSNVVHLDSNDAYINDNGKVDFISIDLGGKYSIYNYHGDLVGESSKSNLDSIYLGDKKKVIDINYIITHKGVRSNSNINVKGALQGESQKHFKGTIDFKKGSSKSVGAEDEYCMLLSKKAKAKAMPILLCSEDDVSGEHSAASGRIDENKLFYLMSRGLSYEEAKILIVRAAFNPIIDSIGVDDIKKEILASIDRSLKNE